jgi:hypothetical protein
MQAPERIVAADSAGGERLPGAPASVAIPRLQVQGGARETICNSTRPGGGSTKAAVHVGISAPLDWWTPFNMFRAGGNNTAPDK